MPLKPAAPGVDVAALIACAIARCLRAVRAAGEVRPVRVGHCQRARDEAGKEFFVTRPRHFAGPVVALAWRQPLGRVAKPLFQLVVPAPAGQAGMVAQALGVVDHLVPDVLPKCLVPNGIRPTAEQHVLPDEEPQLVAEVVKHVVRKVAPAPHPEHIHVHRRRGLEVAPVPPL